MCLLCVLIIQAACGRRACGTARVAAARRLLPVGARAEPSTIPRTPRPGLLQGVVFEDRLSPRLGLPAASCAGRDAYARLLWSLRFHRMLFFRQAKVG